MADGTEGGKDFVSEENLPKLVVERLAVKPSVPDGGTEKPFDSVGRVWYFEGSNLVDTDALRVDGIPGIDIERDFVGTEPDDVLDELKLTLKVEFVEVGFDWSLFEFVNVLLGIEWRWSGVISDSLVSNGYGEFS